MLNGWLLYFPSNFSCYVYLKFLSYFHVISDTSNYVYQNTNWKPHFEAGPRANKESVMVLGERCGPLYYMKLLRKEIFGWAAPLFGKLDAIIINPAEYTVYIIQMYDIM